MKKRILTMILVLAIGLTPCSTALADTSYSQSAIQAQITETANYITSTYEPDLYSYWEVMYVARAGVDNDDYYNKYILAVKDELDTNGTLTSMGSESVVTYAATVLALGMIGVDVTDFYGYNLIEKMAALGTDSIYAQGYASSLPVILWALNAYADEIDDSTMEGAAKSHMLSFFDGDGFETTYSYEWGGTTYEGISLDTTAMCIAALAMYYDTDSDIQQKIDISVNWLQEKMNQGLADNSNTAAKILTAFSILGGDLVQSTEVSGMNLVDYVMSFKSSTTAGAFTYYGEDNLMSTYQVLEALLSYDRMQSGLSHIYDLSDLTDNKEESSVDPSSIASSGDSNSSKTDVPRTGDFMPVVFLGAFLMMTAAVAVVKLRKKHHN